MSFKRLLIVDDSEAEQFLYKSIVEDYNSEIEVISAFDGAEALEIIESEAAKNQKICCILLDINMPRMNGFEFLDRYSELYEKEHVVVAMLTSSIQTKDKEKALSYACVNDFFIKPITRENLDDLAKLTS